MTREQYERIKANSRSKGFASLSAYLRYVALDQDFIVQQKICEIYDFIFGKKATGKFKKNRAAPFTS